MNNYVEQLNGFLKKIVEFEHQYENEEKKRIKFVTDFSIDNIKNMSIDEYVTGKGKITFCNRIENELKELGDIHGSTAIKFGIYYGKLGNDKSLKYRFLKCYSNNEEAFEKTKKEIIKLIEAGELKDYETIRKVKLSPTFRGKILATYYPEFYLPIFADSHLDYFCHILNIEIKDKDDTINKQFKLIDWKNKQKDLKELNNYLFEQFLYKFIGKPKIDKLIEAKEDVVIQEKLAKETELQYKNVKIKPPKLVKIGSNYTYKRNVQNSINALCKACFFCEIDNEHKTFIRKKSKDLYTESHHLIPMAYQNEFVENLDREENIVSLCSNCHNWIHYGKDAEKLLTKLYESRKEKLENAGIKVTLKRLLKMYK